MGRGEPIPRLRQARLAAAVTQQELATAAGLDRNTVVRLETHPEKPADMSTIRALADALGVQPRDLMAQG